MTPISPAALDFAEAFDISPEIAQAIVETFPASSAIQYIVWDDAFASERDMVLTRAWELASPEKAVLDWHGPVLRPGSGGR